MTSTDFAVFLNVIEDLDDAFCLDQTIRTGSDYGSYHYKEQGERIFITSDDWHGDTLVLANEKSKKYFLQLLEERWSKEKMPLDIYYEMKRQMAKED